MCSLIASERPHLTVFGSVATSAGALIFSNPRAQAMEAFSAHARSVGPMVCATLTTVKSVLLMLVAKFYRRARFAPDVV